MFNGRGLKCKSEKSSDGWLHTIHGGVHLGQHVGKERARDVVVERMAVRLGPPLLEVCVRVRVRVRGCVRVRWSISQILPMRFGVFCSAYCSTDPRGSRSQQLSTDRVESCRYEKNEQSTKPRLIPSLYSRISRARSPSKPHKGLSFPSKTVSNMQARWMPSSCSGPQHAIKRRGEQIHELLVSTNKSKNMNPSNFSNSPCP